MKKLLLTLCVAFAALATQAQSYYYYQTKGATDAQWYLFGGGTTSIICDPSSPLSTWQSLPSGFTFNFYGQSVTGFYAAKDGYITFDNTASSSVSSNTSLPDAGTPNNAIYAFWDDVGFKTFSATNKTTCRTWVYGTAPNRELVVFWLWGVPGGASGNGTLDMGIVLHEGSSDFETFYLYSDNGSQIGATGTSATVGCENSDGTDGSMVSNNFSFPNTADGTRKNGVTIHFKYGTQPDFDGAVVSSTLNDVEKNGNINIGGSFVNYGKTTITSMDLNYSVNGGTTVTQSLTGLNITGNGGTNYTFTHGTPWSGMTSGQSYDVKVWASNFNSGGTDGDASNDSYTSKVFVNDGVSTPRMTLFEEGSGAWCGFCVDGHRIMKDIVENYSGVIPVVHHNSDGMTNSESDKINGRFAGGYPSGWVDRNFWSDQGSVGVNRGVWEDKITTSLNNPSPVKVSITNKSYDNTTRTISFTVRAEFVDYWSGDMRLNAFVVEDKVRGKNQQSVWTQHNYYAGGAIDPNNPLSNEPEWLVGYLHRHVVRNIPSGAWGTTGVIPSVAKPGDVFTQTYTYKIPKEISVSYTGTLEPSDLCDQTPGYAMNKPMDFSLIGFVSVYDANDDHKVFILNSTEEASLWATGVTPVKNTEVSSTIYPNPVTSVGTLELTLDQTAQVTIEVVNVVGQKVKTVKSGTFTSGTHTVYFNNEGLESGVYFMNIITNGQVTSKRFTVIK